MPKPIKDNGLTIALVLLFLGSLIGHWLNGSPLRKSAVAGTQRAADQCTRLSQRCTVPVDGL